MSADSRVARNSAIIYIYIYIHLGGTLACLCGPIQTVPRSELSAVLIIARKVHSGAKVDSFTDSKITKDTYYKGSSRARFAANSDL